MEKQTHEQKYEALCKQYGVVWTKDSPRLVGITLKQLQSRFKTDEHLNNIPLRRWDSLAITFLAHNRNTGLSLADAVCMQKHSAKMLIKSI